MTPTSMPTTPKMIAAVRKYLVICSSYSTAPPTAVVSGVAALVAAPALEDVATVDSLGG